MILNAGLRNDEGNYRNHRGVLDAIAEVSDESRASTPQGRMTKIIKKAKIEYKLKRKRKRNEK